MNTCFTPALLNGLIGGAVCVQIVCVYCVCAGCLESLKYTAVFVDIQMLRAIWVGEWCFFLEFSSYQHVPQ